MREQIITENAPAAVGPYSQAIAVNGFLFTSGQLPLDPETGKMPEGIEAQTKASLNNIKAVLEGAGLGIGAAIKCTVFIKDMNDFKKMNEVYSGFFENPFPARSCVEVARLPMDALVEIECIATME